MSKRQRNSLTKIEKLNSMGGTAFVSGLFPLMHRLLSPLYRRNEIHQSFDRLILSMRRRGRVWTIAAKLSTRNHAPNHAPSLVSTSKRCFTVP